MSIQLNCPGGHSLTIPDAWAGRTGRCPVCKAPVQVPAISHATRIAPSPAPPPLPALVSRVNGAKPAEPPPMQAQPSPLKTSNEKPAAEIAATVTPPPMPAQAPQAVSASRPADQPAASTPPSTPRPTPIPPLRETVAPAPSVEPGYRPDADKRQTVYLLAAAMAALSVFCMLPAMPYLNLGLAPGWARAALLVSLLQIAYAAWLISIPDWASLRSSMILFTVVAALYGLTMTVALSTPQESTLPLDLTEVRRQAVLWCAGIVLLASLVAYSCGRAAWRWRRTLDLLHI